MLKEAQDPAPGQKADPLHIGYRARQQLTGLRAVVIRKGQGAQLFVDGVADVIGDALRCHFRPASQHKIDQALRKRQRKQPKKRSLQEC